MKVITINVSDLHLSFFEKLIDLGIVPSRSEAMRHCIDISMPYYNELINLYVNKVNNLPDENIKQFTSKINELIPNNDSCKSNNSKKKLGNKFWEDRFIDNRWIKVPVDPDKEKEQETEVYIDGMGYVKVEEIERIGG